MPGSEPQDEGAPAKFVAARPCGGRAGGARFITSILSGGGGAFSCPRARRTGGGAAGHCTGVESCGPQQPSRIPRICPAFSKHGLSPPVSPIPQAPGISTKETSPCDLSVCREVKPFKESGETSKAFGYQVFRLEET